MRDRIYNFMRSRYGVDQLSSFLTWGGVIFILIDMFARTGIFYLLGIIMLIYGYIRVLSKKYERRAAQNRWFLERTAGIRGFFKSFSNRMRKRREVGKDYKVFTCSRCRQMIRVPKKKGKIEIRCPKCGNTFIKRT
ncbi:MAG: hypothetical protein LUE96_08965 [Lachnospiraceae bacterium]|nr:hypothetical protein [Lachnospiraceae bacterium]